MYLAQEYSRFKSIVSQSHLQLLLEENCKLLAKLEAFQPAFAADKLELMQKLRDEEQLHLADMNVLADRNRELQAEVGKLHREKNVIESTAKDSETEYGKILQQQRSFITTLCEFLHVSETSPEFVENAVMSKLVDFYRKSKENADALRMLQELFPDCDASLVDSVKNLLLKSKGQQPFLIKTLLAIQELQCGLSTQVRGAELEYFALKSDLAAAKDVFTDFQNSLVADITRYVTCLRIQVKQGFELRQLSQIESQVESLLQVINEILPLLQQFRAVETLSDELRSSNMSLAQELSSRADELHQMQSRNQYLEQEIEDLKVASLALEDDVQRHQDDLFKQQEFIIEKDRLHKEEMERLKKGQDDQVKLLQEEIERLRKRQGEMDGLEKRHADHVKQLEKEIECLKREIGESEGPFPQHSSEEPDIINSVIAPRLLIPLRSLANPVVVTFTGFRAGHPTYNPCYQLRLTQIVTGLGGKVHNGVEFTDDITHVMAPRGYRSIRVLAASLTAKWIISGEWLEACEHAGYFVNEMSLDASCVGFQNLICRPFKGKTLWMSAGFEASHRTHPQYPSAALRILLEKLGRARWVSSKEEADYLLVLDGERSAQNCLTLSALIDMIPVN